MWAYVERMRSNSAMFTPRWIACKCEMNTKITYGRKTQIAIANAAIFQDLGWYVGSVVPSQLRVTFAWQELTFTSAHSSARIGAPILGTSRAFCSISASDMSCTLLKTTNTTKISDLQIWAWCCFQSGWNGVSWRIVCPLGYQQAVNFGGCCL